MPHARVVARSLPGRKSVHFRNVYSYTKFVQVVVTIKGYEICMYRNGVKPQSDPIADTTWNLLAKAETDNSTKIWYGDCVGIMKSVAMLNRSLLAD